MTNKLKEGVIVENVLRELGYTHFVNHESFWCGKEETETITFYTSKETASQAFEKIVKDNYKDYPEIYKTKIDTPTTSFTCINMTYEWTYLVEVGEL